MHVDTATYLASSNCDAQPQYEDTLGCLAHTQYEDARYRLAEGGAAGAYISSVVYLGAYISSVVYLGAYI